MFRTVSSSNLEFPFLPRIELYILLSINVLFEIMKKNAEITFKIYNRKHEIIGSNFYKVWVSYRAFVIGKENFSSPKGLTSQRVNKMFQSNRLTSFSTGFHGSISNLIQVRKTQELKVEVTKTIWALSLCMKSHMKILAVTLIYNMLWLAVSFLLLLSICHWLNSPNWKQKKKHVIYNVEVRIIYVVAF